MDMIARRELTGDFAAFYYKDAAWHGKGNVLEHRPDMDEALNLLGNFDLMELPVKVTIQGQDYTLGNYKALLRGDVASSLDITPSLVDRACMQIAGKEYASLDYRHHFEILNPLIDKGLLSLESGATLDDGKRAFLLGEWNLKDTSVMECFKNNELKPYFLATSGHDGLHGPEWGNTVIRVECANMLAIARAISALVKLRHVGKVRERLVLKAEEFFAKVIEHFVNLGEEYQVMRQRILTVEEFTKGILDKIVPLPAITKDEDKYTRAYASAELKRDAFTYKWENGQGHKGDHSAWEAYNGIVEVIDHNESLYRVNKGGSRVNQLLGGRLEQRKDEALDAIMALVK